MRLISVFVAVALAGCATTRLNDGLKKYLGHDVKEVVDRLGYPTGQRSVMGDTIYIWSQSENSTFPMPTTSRTTGQVAGMPVSGTTTGTEWVPMNFSCTIQIAVSDAGYIKNIQWEGNQRGCSSYANAISR